MDLLITTLLISMAIQAVFFVFAVSLKTDKVTDLSYGLSFVALAIYLLLAGAKGAAGFVLAGMVILWGVRIAAYLFYRILVIGKDARFDGIRENFLRFAIFWISQGIVVYVLMLPVTLWFRSGGSMSNLLWFGVAVWAMGLVIETIADWQKFSYLQSKNRPTPWIQSGLWKYSRHPNYLGEILCWIGVFAASIAVGGSVLGIISPITIIILLVFITGIPPLEKKADAKYAGNEEYRKYKLATGVLFPKLKLF